MTRAIAMKSTGFSRCASNPAVRALDTLALLVARQRNEPHAVAGSAAPRRYLVTVYLGQAASKEHKIRIGRSQP